MGQRARAPTWQVRSGASGSGSAPPWPGAFAPASALTPPAWPPAQRPRVRWASCSACLIHPRKGRRKHRKQRNTGTEENRHRGIQCEGQAKDSIRQRGGRLPSNASLGPSKGFKACTPLPPANVMTRGSLEGAVPTCILFRASSSLYRASWASVCAFCCTSFLCSSIISCCRFCSAQSMHPHTHSPGIAQGFTEKSGHPQQAPAQYSQPRSSSYITDSSPEPVQAREQGQLGLGFSIGPEAVLKIGQEGQFAPHSGPESSLQGKGHGPADSLPGQVTVHQFAPTGQPANLKPQTEGFEV